MRIKKWLLSGIVLCGMIGSYLYYNHIFLRTSEESKIAQVINWIPYIAHFKAQQQQPASFFTAASFPAYTQWCHENKKLCSIMPLQQLYADMQWLGSIQFVWGQWRPEEIVWLGKMLDSLTTISPYREYPYTFGQLLIPIPKSPYKKVGSWSEFTLQKESWASAENLAKKGEYYTCDAEKIKAIRGLSEKDFINAVYDTTGARIQYSNPCASYERAHYAAFNAFNYTNNPELAAQNYKISAFHDGAPSLTPLMAALVYGRWGEHLKSASLWYDRYLNLMSVAAQQDDILLQDADRAIKKAVFELQLQLITEASDKTPECETSYTCLEQKDSIKKSIQNTYNNICKGWKEQYNIRCILFATAVQYKRITLDGKLVYPLENGFIFTWDEDYNSRWITQK